MGSLMNMKSEKKRSRDEESSSISTSVAVAVAVATHGGTRAHPPQEKKVKPNACISLLSDDEDENVERPYWASYLGDDDVEIISPDKTTSTGAMMNAQATVLLDDEEVNVIGQQNVVRLPHARHNCLEHKFTPNVRPLSFSDLMFLKRKEISENELHCDLCYCYVCDEPVNKCIQWDAVSCRSNHCASFSYLPHCLASDIGAFKHSWKSERDNRKIRSKSGLPNHFQQRLQAVVAANYRKSPPQRETVASSLYCVGKGPWPPTDKVAAQFTHFIQCRKCKWYNAMRPDLALKPEARTDEGWCHACGRVASSQFSDKEQAIITPPPKGYQTGTGDAVFLGERTIEFRLHSHDPSKMEAFRDRWKSECWNLDKVEMDDDTFHQRIGPIPLLKNILKMIAIVEPDKIPVDGHIRKPFENHNPYNPNLKLKGPSALYTSAMLLENFNDKALLEQLQVQRINEVKFGEKPSKVGAVGGAMTASWDRIERKGKLKISVYLNEKAFLENSTVWANPTIVGSTLSRFFAAWYDVSFRLHELLPMKIDMSNEVERLSIHHDFETRYRRLAAMCNTQETKAYSQEEEDNVKDFNETIEKETSHYTFQSSTRNDNGGGTSSTDTSFPGTLRRYFGETVVEDAISETISGIDCSARFSWYARNIGVVGHSILDSSTGYPPKFGAYLRGEDDPLLMENATKATWAIWQRTKTFHGLLQQLENLGHESAPHVDGLNVELLGFQRQAVGWAIERENMPGGIQSLLWTKLPMAHGRCSEDLWFNPILDCVSKTPPKCVRGGFICHEMGLGKTVISLAIVLQNPAPTMPESGTIVSGVTPAGWFPLEKASLGKYGRIYSRATLVICSVSLVGQWIDEAKSKLKDPGMVYAYYGGSRSRFAELLSKNAIVVTTYGTISSDATYWSQKSETPDYVPPCEQIYWWRVICDESHTLRNGSSVCSRIAAMNRWAVTGTPINTRVADLKEQLRFIGVEHVDHYFRKCESLWLNHQNQGSMASRKRGHDFTNSDSPIGNFLFLFRGMLMRHTMKMTTRGGNIDIMSLPPKSERVVEIKFSPAERVEYKRLEGEALQRYKCLRKSFEFGKHYLAILQLLNPTRLACAGGPLEDKEPSEKHAKAPYQMKEDDTTECAICLDLLHDGRATLCNHLFCRECIVGVIENTGEKDGPCPLCRESVLIHSLRPVVAANTATVVEVTAACDKKTAFVFDSKIKYLVDQLKLIRDNDPSSKSLIFSQFQSTLKWLQKELPKHGFQFRTLTGDMTMPARAKALREFQSEPPTTVFLLSLRAGAVGINLTQANRVFIMEPAYNPALEAQAIGRVHRLGQTRNVKITRLIMKNSFESRLIELFRTGKANKSTEDDDEATDDLNNDGEGVARGSSPEPITSSSAEHHDISKVGPPVELVGNLMRDRPKLGREEFDHIFNLKSE